MVYIRSLEHIHLILKVYSLWPTSLYFPHPQPWLPPSHSMNSTSSIPHISKIIQYLPFCVWFVSSIIIPSKLIHVVTNGKIFFFVMAQYYSTVYMYHIFFIHSSADGHLGCDRVLAIVNNAAMNIGVQRALWDSDFTFLDTHPEVKLLDQVIVLFLIFWGVFRLFFIMTVPIYILRNSIQVSPFCLIITNICLILW